MTLRIESLYQNIALIEKRSDNYAAELTVTFADRSVCVCDFYVRDSEQGRLDDSGAIELDGLLIIDHHAPLPRMMSHISSAVIANRYVRQHGPLPAETVIVINHTDADAILSALIMGGYLPPDDSLGQAAIAADHTGEQNNLADLLQALEDDRNLPQSVAVLQKVLARHKDRQTVRELVEAGKVLWADDIACLIVERKIDAGLVPALLPEARVVIVASPMPNDSLQKWRIRVRLGLNADGVLLNTLGLPDSGGRWNALSTSRLGGTNVTPEEYLQRVRQAVTAAKGSGRV